MKRFVILVTRLTLLALLSVKCPAQAGGTILGIRLLPTASPEAGDNDSLVKDGIASIFGSGVRGTQASGVAQRGAKAGGSFYCQRSSI